MPTDRSKRNTLSLRRLKYINTFRFKRTSYLVHKYCNSQNQNFFLLTGSRQIYRCNLHEPAGVLFGDPERQGPRSGMEEGHLQGHLQA